VRHVYLEVLMRRSISAITLVVLLVSTTPLLAQRVSQAQQAAQPQVVVPVRDPQAIILLHQCVSAIGGPQVLNGINDFTGTGTITYYWAGEEVNGSVTVKGGRPDQFRLDAQLPSGVRSWSVSNGQGKIKEPNGDETIIPFHGGINQGSLTLPYTWVRSELRDPLVSISAATQQLDNGRQVYLVHVWRNFTPKQDPTGNWTKWSARTYAIDATSFLIVGMQTTIRSSDSPVQEFRQDVLYSNFQQVNGVVVPFSITEKIGGQQTWAIQLSAIQFNTGLTEANFHF
jgi:hypothetical protein